jgi:hypothetical protein
MTASVMRCRCCHKHIMRFTAAMWRLDNWAQLVDQAVAEHNCPALPCPACGKAIVHDQDLPAHVIHAAQHNHHRYCKGQPQ